MQQTVLDKYIHELTWMQLHGYALANNKYFDVYIMNKNSRLAFISDDSKANPPSMSIKVGRVTVVKNVKTYRGSELQRKCREEIQTILCMLKDIGVIE